MFGVGDDPRGLFSFRKKGRDLSGSYIDADLLVGVPRNLVKLLHRTGEEMFASTSAAMN